MSKLETNTIDTISGSTDLQLGSTNATIIKANDKILFNNSGDGIYLGVTSATASNLLDDYEEGTWTPVLTAQTGSISSYSAEGKYTKIGDLVYLWMYWNISNVGTATDNCFISGYPFTAKATTTNNVHYVGVGRNSSNNTGSITITEETTSGLINLYNGGISSNIMATGMNWRFTLVYLAD